ncbi:MAG: molybdopterin molybdotransferase MoeA [Spirochaetaceae bacterium]|nr:molybdopterin molybdotransferase MoeA [Spirochaetaceae bacterium]
MIELNQIFDILNKQHTVLKTERVPLGKAVGRVLPVSVYSTMDSPPFDKSAMDGWAVRGDESETELTSIDIIGAGDVSFKKIEKGTCASIMTGAKIPEGTGRIIRIEYTHRDGEKVFIDRDDPHKNIIRRGENLKKGDIVLTPRILNPGDIGILASSGLAEVDVALAPSIGILTTGSELKEPGDILEDGEIYNSNGHQLMAQANVWGCSLHYYGIIKDDKKELKAVIKKALSQNDLVLLSGGVSMGEFDYVPQILEDSGVNKIFHKAAIKPGRPLWFGKNDNTYVFGMPGNPVSTYILFEVLVKHLILHLCGLKYEPAFLRGILGKEIHRRTWDRAEFLPVKWVDNEIIPIMYHGSSHLNAMAEAKGLIIVDPGIKTLLKGETVNVRLL